MKATKVQVLVVCLDNVFFIKVGKKTRVENLSFFFFFYFICRYSNLNKVRKKQIKCNKIIKYIIQDKYIIHQYIKFTEYKLL